MKPLNDTAGIAAKQIMLATNYVKRGNAAGGSDIAGGTKTAAGGIPTAIGMTAIIIVLNSCRCFSGRGWPRPVSISALR